MSPRTRQDAELEKAEQAWSRCRRRARDRG